MSRLRTPEQRAKAVAATQRWRERHGRAAEDPVRIAERIRQKYWADPEARRRQIARAAVNKAVRKGNIVRPARCSQCGQPGRIEGHHFDYDQKLNVVWLCRLCHAVLHKQERDTMEQAA